MSRAIKFRAWNSAEQGIYQNVGIIPCENGYKAVDSVGGLIHDMYSSQPTVMQSSGLVDKNGCEIYEGDIVTILYPNNKEAEREYRSVVRYGRVNVGANGFEYDYWINGFYCETVWNQQPCEHVTNHMIEDGDVVVLGNVHENPELLEQQG